MILTVTQQIGYVGVRPHRPVGLALRASRLTSVVLGDIDHTESAHSLLLFRFGSTNNASPVAHTTSSP